MILALSVVLALVLDKLLGEPKRYHPLIGFGHYASTLEGRLNPDGSSSSSTLKRFKGIWAVFLAIMPWVFLSGVLVFLSREYLIFNGEYPALEILMGGGFLYIAIGWQSLLAHAQQVAVPLSNGDIEKSREYVSWIVSRDTAQLNEVQVAKAATESVLENGADAIFAAIFWFCLLGIPGVVLYRCANTLDAMWGYKSEKFLFFGWAAARLDDVLNYLPARLTALSYALLAKPGHRGLALKCWRAQGYIGKSPNAGPVMAAGAGALNVSLGGAASYHHRIEQKPVLGPSETLDTQANHQSINEACRLINRTLLLWVVVIFALSLVSVCV